MQDLQILLCILGFCNSFDRLVVLDFYYIIFNLRLENLLNLFQSQFNCATIYSLCVVLGFTVDFASIISDLPGMFISGGTSVLEGMVWAMGSVLFFKVGPLPLVIWWIMASFLFFTVRLNFIPFRLLPHTIDVIKGKYDKKSDIGIFTHKEAICTAALGTVGLGSIAGVAVAVVQGGPGAIIWMIIIGLLGVSVKFAEVTIAHKYREIDKKTGEVSGGPITYVRAVFKGKWAPLGKFLSLFYALCLIGMSLTSANMFQSNQSMMALKDSFPIIAEHSQFFAWVVVSMVGAVAIGGASFIGKLGAFLVPIMSLLYMVLAVIVIFVQRESLGDSICVIFTEAFKVDSVKWGMVGAIVAGAIRSIYTTESGGGTSGMAHAPAKTSEPVRQGLTAAVEAFIPILVSIVTGLVIVVTGVYKSADNFGGILLTKQAFGEVSSWFPQILSISIFSIAITTVMAWTYYGKLSWIGVFGNRGIVLYILIFLSATYYGMVATDQNLILRLADCLWLSATIPNIIAIYMSGGDVRRWTLSYYKRLKAGEFTQ